MKKFFTSNLLEWNAVSNKRIMPWKGVKDPYKIWLSEIILQQTRVEQGLSYYNKFLSNYPTVQHLAKAPDEEVMKLWEGLGYYSRCRNLLATARIICENFNGSFPNTYGEILGLRGIGSYTAAAIASFAFKLPYAVLDGNVYRVLSRYFGEATPIDTVEGKKIFGKLSSELLPVKEPGIYNQAIMDFGATVCKPLAPLCEICILNDNCLAYKKGWVNKLPIKEKKLVKRNRFFYYFIFIHKNQVLVRQRKHNDIWKDLYEFYLCEKNVVENWSKKKLESFLVNEIQATEFDVIAKSKKYKQQLTHQKIEGEFITVELKSIPETLQHFTVYPLEQLATLAFPKFINQYLPSFKQEQVLLPL